MEEYYIGLMSGTSLDAIDVAITQIDEQSCNIIAADSHALPADIKQAIAELCHPGNNEIERMGKLDFQLGNLFAEATLKLIRLAKLAPSDIKAIGSHGQTIRHRPTNKAPFSLQIGNPARISEVCNITTVADFRRADIAAGGQVAPLVPAFHQDMFSHSERNRFILNIGGMANISLLPPKKSTITRGFDTGPGNVLLNAWVNIHKQHPYDDNGEWSASHPYNETLLNNLLSHSYFGKPPPKSTGREVFDLHWLDKKLHEINETIEPGVVQSTLCELSARSIADSIKLHEPNSIDVIVCGGGAHNHDLISRIEKHLQTKIRLTDELGVEADYVEAAAFAWLARQALHLKPANLPAVTGAKHPVILGAIYPRWDNAT